MTDNNEQTNYDGEYENDSTDSNQESESENESEKEIPLNSENTKQEIHKEIEHIRKILYDLTKDLLITFPELEKNLNSNLKCIISTENITDELVFSVNQIKDYCIEIYPKKFFDILYQNEKIFDGDEPLFLLPNIDFKILWKENISDNTKTTIWKYLQLLLFSLVSEIPDSNSFGDTAKLFEAIDTDEFKTKLEETISNMETCFDMSNNGFSDMSFNNHGDLPDPTKLHDDLNKMMDGKLGNLAREIAEETAKDININLNDESSVNDVFKTLFQNPTKLMDLVTKVGSKLDTKIKSGEIKESELLNEAAEMMQNMKNMPGMDNIQNLFKQHAMGNNKMNVNAMHSHLQRNIKLAKQKERMREKAKQNTERTEETNTTESFDLANKAAMDLLLSEGVNFDEMENFIFRTGEKYEKTARNPENNLEKKKKRKKKKRKQNK